MAAGAVVAFGHEELGEEAAVRHLFTGDGAGQVGNRARMVGRRSIRRAWSTAAPAPNTPGLVQELPRFRKPSAHTDSVGSGCRDRVAEEAEHESYIGAGRIVSLLGVP